MQLRCVSGVIASLHARWALKAHNARYAKNVRDAHKKAGRNDSRAFVYKHNVDHIMRN